MKDHMGAKTYDSVEYGLLVPDNLVVPERQKKRHSCAKCLCITLVVTLCLSLVTAAVVSACGYYWMKHQVRRFTTDTPMKFPIHELPEAELEVVVDRAKLFYDSLRAGVPAEDLTISEDELNGFVAHSDYLRGNAIVHLDDNKFAADMSLPAEGLPGGKGRFFVASGFLSFVPETDQTLITTELKTPYNIEGLEYPTIMFAELVAFLSSEGKKVVNAKSAQFYNWVAPPDFVEKKENLLDHVCDDEDMDDEDCREVLALVNGIESISIVDKKITFRARASINGNQMTFDSSGDNRRLRSKSGNRLEEKSYEHYVRRALQTMIRS